MKALLWESRLWIGLGLILAMVVFSFTDIVINEARRFFRIERETKQ